MPQVDDEDDDGLSQRRDLPAGKRLDLVERDLRSHARSLSHIVDAGKKFSPEQLAQIEKAVREVLSEVGLRLDDPDHVDAIREDQRFLRGFRLWWNGAANKVGNIVLVAIVGLALTIAGAGFWAWLKSGGGSP
jgi:hypothetical protein